MSDYASEFSIRRLWIIFGASMVDHVRRPALLRRPDLSCQAADAGRGADRLGAGRSTPATDIQRGQAVWQSTGGMQQGSIWGHGGYVAPDWSADWLHREAIALRDGIAGTGSGARSRRWRNPIRRGSAPCCRREMRTNGYDPQTSDHHRQRPAGGRHRGDRGALSTTCSPTARRPTSICASSTRCRRTRC